MHLHLVRVASRPKHLQPDRPAKVVQLAARRQARLERLRQERDRPRPAA